MPKPRHTGSDDDRPQGEQPSQDLSPLLSELREQTRLLAQIRRDGELDPCLLDKIGRISCMTANEVHQNTLQLKAIRQAIEALVEMYRTVNPAAALEHDRLAKLRAEIERCCPPEDKPELICRYEPCVRDGGVRHGDGWSAKSQASVQPEQIGERPHRPWQIVDGPHHEEDDELPTVPQGAFFAQTVLSLPTPNVLDFRSGGAPTPGGQEPVSFRTFTSTEISAIWPPDMSGAKSGDVVLMCGNLWLKLSVDGGKTFTDLDFTKLFAAESTYGGWAGDPVLHYVPSIDCFVFYVQSRKGKSGANLNKNVVKIALASPADLKKFSGGRDAWRRQYHFTSDTFGLGASWMDFPDISYGDKFLHVNSNVFAGQKGKVFYELPLADLQAGRGFGFLFAFIKDEFPGSPIQNILGDQNYFARHVDNSTMRIYQSNGGDPNYSWRDRKINNWPMTSDNEIVSAAPDWADWLSTDHRIIGATRVASQIWFAWTASTGDGGGGGFKFPHPHIQIAKFELTQDFKLVEPPMQIWNPDHAFSYPCLITNANNEVGISLAWGGGGKFCGSHAVGIIGDFVVWYGVASTETSLRQQTDDAGNGLNNPDGTPMMFSRWGDYVHVRLAQPDTRFFSAFGYAVVDNPSPPPGDKMQYLYIEFGRNPITPPPLH